MSQSADRRGLRRNFSWSLVAQVVYAGCQWGALTLLAKVGTQEEAESRLGAFVLALAITGPILMFTRMQLRELVATDTEDRHTPREYMAARVAAMIVMIVVSIVAALVLGEDSEVVAIVAIVAIARLVEGLLDLAHGFFEHDDRHMLVALSQGLRGPAGLIGMAVGLLATGSIVVATIGMLAGWVLVWIANDAWRLRAQLGERWSRVSESGLREGAWAVVRRALPLGIVASLISFNTNLPRYFIDAAEGMRMVGVFGSIAYVLAVLAMVSQALTAAAAPRLARHLASGDLRAVRRLIALTLLVASVPGLAIMALAWVWGGPILTLLYRAEFAPHAHILVILSLAGILGGAAGALRVFLTAGNVLVAQVPVLIATVAVTGVVGWIMVPGAPLEGGAWATVAGRAVLFAVNAVLVVQLLRRRGLGPRQEERAHVE